MNNLGRQKNIFVRGYKEEFTEVWEGGVVRERGEGRGRKGEKREERGKGE